MQAASWSYRRLCCWQCHEATTSVASAPTPSAARTRTHSSSSATIASLSSSHSDTPPRSMLPPSIAPSRTAFWCNAALPHFSGPTAGPTHRKERSCGRAGSGPLASTRALKAPKKTCVCVCVNALALALAKEIRVAGAGPAQAFDPPDRPATRSVVLRSHSQSPPQRT